MWSLPLMSPCWSQGPVVRRSRGPLRDEVGMSPEQQSSHEAAYGRVCESYQAIDDFRMKLLGLLPVATGTGVFLLLNDNVPVLGTKASQGQPESLASILAVIGAFGTVFT